MQKMCIFQHLLSVGKNPSQYIFSNKKNHSIKLGLYSYLSFLLLTHKTYDQWFMVKKENQEP